ncbi:hypothetical protein SVAN01_04959 [Stagonosporopsis vannaccii]|nr:hypothetical protein SVAN01_04959 [Stagonosporopsis vannaccii]
MEEVEIGDVCRKQATIWKVRFFFDLTAFDPTRDDTWTGGKGSTSKLGGVQFLMADNGLRNRHIFFRLSPQNGGIIVAAKSVPTGKIYVDGAIVGDSGHTVYTGSHNISIAGLQFRLIYLPLAYSSSWNRQRDEYIKKAYKDKAADTLHMAPTPGPESWETQGWILQSELGQGGEGTVFVTSHTNGDTGTLKRIVRTRHNSQFEKRKVKLLTDMAQKLRVEMTQRGMIDQPVVTLVAMSEAQLRIRCRETIHYVYRPLCADTLEHHIHYTMEPDELHRRRLFFKDLLVALDVVHSMGFVHRDIKPANIGIKNGKVVLLDVDQLESTQGIADIKPTPGYSGTPGYLAPERELEHYSCPVDMWAAGITLYEMLYGHHPWKLSKPRENPFRQGNLDTSIFDEFIEQYDCAMDLLEDDPSEPLAPLLIRLLASEYIERNDDPRITAKEALQHACWSKVNKYGQSSYTCNSRQGSTGKHSDGTSPTAKTTDSTPQIPDSQIEDEQSGISLSRFNSPSVKMTDALVGDSDQAEEGSHVSRVPDSLGTRTALCTTRYEQTYVQTSIDAAARTH